jgi:hypothetical protein
MRIIRKKISKSSKKKKKRYPAQRGGFKLKKHARQLIRFKDIDQAIYYPNRTKEL